MTPESPSPRPLPAAARAECEPFVRVPLSVLARQDLPSNAKLLFGLVAALAHKEGYCWASNPYLADRLALTPKHVSELVGLLEARGLLEIRRCQARGNLRHLFLAASAPNPPAPVFCPPPPLPASPPVFAGDPLRRKPDVSENPKSENPKKEKDKNLSLHSLDLKTRNAGRPDKSAPNAARPDGQPPNAAFRAAHAWLRQQNGRPHAAPPPPKTPAPPPMPPRAAGTDGVPTGWHRLRAVEQAAFAAQATALLRRAGLASAPPRAVQAASLGAAQNAPPRLPSSRLPASAGLPASGFL